jgi:selenocysteine lyase/cysteine desulfurase
MHPPDHPSPQPVREREFPIVAEYAYLNTATQGPLPSVTRRAIELAAQRGQFPGTPRAQAAPPAELARAGLAGLLGVAADDLALTPNTTYGMNVCAQGIDWRPGDNVVLPDREFPALMRAWLNLRAIGVEVRLVPWQGDGPRVDDLMAAVDARTRAVSCSAVAWDSGYRIDLEDLGRRCARAGALLVVDGIQAVGAVELSPAALRLAALSFHAYKWLVSGFGCGALYVAPGAIDQFHPRFVGEQSFQDGGDGVDLAAPWQAGARRYAAGNTNEIGLTALAASLGLLAEVGLPAIAAHNRELCALLAAGLRQLAPGLRMVTPDDEARRAAIVVFTLGERERDEALVQRLASQGIIVALRRRGLRVSPHFFNSLDEIERLLAALRVELA